MTPWLVTLWTLTGCDAPGEDPELVVDADELPGSDLGLEGQVPTPPAEECNHRWGLSSAATAAGNAAQIPYEYSYSCVGRSQPGAVALGNFLNANFPVGTGGYGVYRCEVLTSPYYSLHSEGRAIDFMIDTDPSQYGGANNAVGDVIADWLIENAAVIGVQSIIWDRTIWRSSYWPRDHCVDISNPHWDHLHIELTWDAANQRTPWFQGAATTPLPGQGPAPGAEPDPHVDPPGTFIIDSNNSYNTWAWGADPSPSWLSSASLPGYFNTGYWRAPTSFWGLDFMDFWFLVGQSQCLSVWGWWPAGPNNAPDTYILSYHEPNGHLLGYDASLVELGRIAVDQRTNGSQWNYLGSYEFPPTWNKISFDRWTESLVGEAVADAVKLMPSGLCASALSPGQIVIDDHNNNNDTSRYYFHAPASWHDQTWVVPSWLFGQYQAQTSFWGLDFADFQFHAAQDTCYDVDAWWTANAGNAPDTYFIAYHEPGGAFDGWDPSAIQEIGRTTKDQTTDGSRWNRLGTWYFPAGWNKVSVDRWTESLQGWAVADAVRLTPSSACVVPCADTDHDGVSDCNETCPTDPAKVSPGACGCGVPDTDADGDSVADCAETCDADPRKTAPGVCGCGVADVDTDGDGAFDCQETCDADPGKTAPGVCGCGVPDLDANHDGIIECGQVCGDGVVQAPEACDDGGTRPGDGCTATCTIEVPRVEPPQPGRAGVANTLRATGFPPGDLVTFLVGSRLRPTPVPGCATATEPLASPVVVGSARADASGVAALSVAVPATAAGRTVAFVAVDRAACRVSEAAFVMFP